MDAIPVYCKSIFVSAFLSVIGDMYIGNLCLRRVANRSMLGNLIRGKTAFTID